MADIDGAPHDSTVTPRTAVLVENHRGFLRYLERRLGSRQAAEDILQDAFVRNLDRFEALPEDALIPWFYRVLRNALIDHIRRRDTADRAMAALAKELDRVYTAPEDVRQEICACVGRLAGTLKPEYAEALQAIDIDGISVKTFAADKGLSAANAGVRVFRARQALKRQVMAACGTCAEHGCLDCSCGSPSAEREV